MCLQWETCAALLASSSKRLVSARQCAVCSVLHVRSLGVGAQHTQLWPESALKLP